MGKILKRTTPKDFVFLFCIIVLTLLMGIQFGTSLVVQEYFTVREGAEKVVQVVSEKASENPTVIEGIRTCKSIMNKGVRSLKEKFGVA
jgi:hypothetical protein